MTQRITEQVIALAGLCQAAHQVHTLAHSGKIDGDALRSSVESILALDAADVASVYGGINRLRLGFDTLVEQMQRRAQFDITKYIITLMHLERRLLAQPKLLQQLRQGISLAQEQANFFHPCHENVFSRLADLYTQTISPLKPKIIVTGSRTHLQDTRTAAQIRTLLMAGIRAAVLWRQVGGRRWHMILHAKRILREAERLQRLAN
jgi:high frequency lysogenization protein